MEGSEFRENEPQRIRDRRSFVSGTIFHPTPNCQAGSPIGDEFVFSAAIAGGG
ncbi:hypothetical protein RE6C_03648 [Rhodopirellula europaea 6C]|uniref:Uncharacterized protein n=1 Tax=Rhodopirellula europaea 6C TaxID=1263867 RepID=M2B021_9BACT|nr:hypothetical protein RE6C_03648 [Rhodopirellula europaea 6C]